MTDFDWNGNAVQLASSMIETVEADRRVAVTKAASLVADGLRNICDTDESAVKVALTVARLLAVVLSSHVSEIGDIADNTMVAYSLAAGKLAGGFDLPETPEPVIDYIPDFLPPEWGKHL